MTDKAISALDAASALTGAELLAVVQGGTTKKATGIQIRSMVAPRLPMASGRSYGPLGMANVAQTPDYGYGYINATPIFIPNPLTIESISIWIATSADAVSQSMRLGIAPDAGGIPSTTLLAESAEIDLVTGTTNQTMPLTGAVVDAPGWFWLMSFQSEPTGGNETGAILHCMDYAKSVGPADQIGGSNSSNPINSDLSALPMALVSSPGVYTEYASLQAALTDLGAPANSGQGYQYFPSIGITIA